MSIQTAPNIYFTGINFNDTFFKTATSTVGYVANSDLVHTYGDELISGDKTFTGTTALNGVLNFDNNIIINYTPPTSTSNTYKGYYGSISGNVASITSNTWVSFTTIVFGQGIWLIKYSQKLNYTGATSSSVTSNKFGLDLTTVPAAYNERTFTQYRNTVVYPISGYSTVYTGSCIIELTATDTYYFVSNTTFTTAPYNINWNLIFTRIA